jgi:integrase
MPYSGLGWQQEHQPKAYRQHDGRTPQAGRQAAGLRQHAREHDAKHQHPHARSRARQFAAGLTTDPARPKYGLHSLRHAAASLFIEQGFSPKRVQALMGHSTIQMTFDVYSHLWPSADDDQVAFGQLQSRVLVA